MILKEFYDPQPSDYQDIADDNSKIKWGETRKTRLTLGMISKMRQMADIQAYERAADLKRIRAQYQPPPAAGPL